MKIKISKKRLLEIAKAMAPWTLGATGITLGATSLATQDHGRSKRSTETTILTILGNLNEDMEELKNKIKSNKEEIDLLNVDTDYTNADIAAIRKILEEKIDNNLKTINEIKNQMETKKDLSKKLSEIEKIAEEIKKDSKEELLNKLKSEILSTLEFKIRNEIMTLSGCDENEINLLTCVKNSISELKEIQKLKEFNKGVKGQLSNIAKLLEEISKPINEKIQAQNQILEEFKKIKQKLENLDREEIIKQNNELRELLHTLWNWFEIRPNPNHEIQRINQWNTFNGGYNNLTAGLKRMSGSTVEVGQRGHS